MYILECVSPNYLCSLFLIGWRPLVFLSEVTMQIFIVIFYFYLFDAYSAHPIVYIPKTRRSRDWFRFLGLSIGFVTLLYWTSISIVTIIVDYPTNDQIISMFLLSEAIFLLYRVTNYFLYRQRKLSDRIRSNKKSFSQFMKEMLRDIIFGISIASVLFAKLHPNVYIAISRFLIEPSSLIIFFVSVFVFLCIDSLLWAIILKPRGKPL